MSLKILFTNTHNYLDEVKMTHLGLWKDIWLIENLRTTSTVIGQTTDRTKKLIDGRIAAIDTNDILNSNNSKKLVELANEMGETLLQHWLFLVSSLTWA